MQGINDQITEKATKYLLILYAILPLIIILLFIFYNGEYGNFATYQVGNKTYFKNTLLFYFLLLFVASSFFLLFYEKIKFDYDISKITMVFILVIVIVIPDYFFRWWWEFYGGGPGPVVSDYRLLLDRINFIIILGFISYIVLQFKSKKRSGIRYGLLLTLIIFLKIMTIDSFPKPPIDVWDTLMLGSSYFLKGINPYVAIYTNQGYGYIANYYPYPPGMILLLLPVRLFYIDVRYAFLVCQVLGALLIYFYAKMDERAELYSFLFLIAPSSYFFLHYAWTELPLIVFFAVIIFYGENDFKLSEKWQIPSYYWRPIVVSFLATLKQTLWLIGPFYAIFILKKSKSKITEFFLAGLTFISIMLPFYIWSPPDFIYDVWTWHAKQVRPESMTINSYLAKNPLFGMHELSINLFLIPYLLLIILYYFWDKIKGRSLEFLDVIRFGTLSLFLFLLWGSLAFMNHYFMIIYLIFLIYVKIIIDSANKKETEIIRK